MLQGEGSVVKEGEALAFKEKNLALQGKTLTLQGQTLALQAQALALQGRRHISSGKWLSISFQFLAYRYCLSRQDDHQHQA